MKTYNQLSLTRFAATIAKLIGVEKPACADEPIDWVCDVMSDLCKEGFDRVLFHNPDAMGLPLRGNHGTDSPQDLNILHYLGAVLRKK